MSTQNGEVKTKYGEVNWGDAASESSKKNSKDLFLRLSPGSNIVRVVTLPHQYYLHKYKVPGERGYGHRVYCSQVHGSCAVCATGDAPKRRWFIGVIDRKSNAYKVLDIGYSVFKSINTLVKDADWGSPDQYDIDIVVDPNGGATGYYAVVAKPPKPLSASDMQLMDNNPSDDLQARTKPPEPAAVEKRIQKLVDEFNAQGGSATSTSGRATMPVSTEEDETDFPNYDQKTKSAPF